ncbi:protoporphyrinogen oxidase [soil metagenome]
MTMIEPIAVPKVIVVGGGIAGQTAGFRLKQRGFAVTVLEANPEIVGGEMSSVRANGFTFNRASTILPSSYTQFVDLARELGVEHKFKGTVEAVFSIPRDGKVHRLRGSGIGAALDMLGTGLLSARSKIGLAKLGIDVAKAKKHVSYDRVATTLDTETIDQYCKRRLNRETEDYLIKALARGFYLYEPDDLSMVDLYFALTKFSGIDFFQYVEGIDFVNRALADALDTVMGARVTHVEETKAGVRVTWQQGRTEHVATADACIMAMPAPHIPQIYPQLSARQKEILGEHIPYGSIIKASHVLDRRPDDPTIAMSIPRCESEAVGIVVFEHNYRPDITAGKGLLGSYWMNDWNQSRMTASDAELEAEMIPEMAKFIPGFADMLEFSHISRWPVATICSYPGMYRTIDEFSRSISAGSPVQFCGDYLNVPGTNMSSLSGERAAMRVADRFAGVLPS